MEPKKSEPSYDDIDNEIKASKEEKAFPTHYEYGGYVPYYEDINRDWQKYVRRTKNL